MPFLSRLQRSLIILALFFLTLMSALRAITWFWFSPAHEQKGSTIMSFLLGFRYDARIVAILILVLLLAGSLPGLEPFSTKAGRRLWLGMSSLFTFLIVVLYTFDFFHFHYLSQRLNASALAFLEDAKISGAMVWQTYPVFRVLIAMVLSLFLLNRLLKRMHIKISKATRVPGRKGGFFLLLFLCALAIFGRVSQYPLRWSDAFNLGSDFRANLALNPFQSFVSSLSFRTTTFDREAVIRYYPLMCKYLGVDKPDTNTLDFSRRVPADPNGNQSHPNVIIVLCESFSAYKSSMWGNPLNTTPFFNAMAQKGLFFDNCFTPHFGTARGVWAMITGIPDVDKIKTASRNPAMVNQHSIINDFSGYEKYYFLGGSTSWANIRGLLTNNIDSLHLYEEGSYDVPDVDVWGISDKNLFLQANKVLGKETKPFIAIIQTADNHRPYTISEEDQKEFRKRTVSADSLKKFGFQSNEELNAFRYTDFGFQKFMEAAEKTPYFQNTIFAFVGDHGIPGDAGSMFPRSWTDHSLSSYHVPLLFYSPKLIPPARNHAVASQVDLLPTVAALANTPHVNTTLGRNLLKPPSGDSLSNVAFIMDHSTFQIGVVSGKYYYERMPDGKKEETVWAEFKNPEPQTGVPQGLQTSYHEITNAFSETARYMLLNNKKQK